MTPLGLDVFLKETLTIRQSRNAGYSLRAFARDLEIGPSTLSELISGRRTPSVKFARRVIERLGADETTASRIVTPLERARNRPPAARGVRKKHVNTSNERLASEWEHFAILNLLKTPDFVADPAWISQRLALSKRKVISSLKLLRSLGCVRKGKNGKLERTVKPLWTGDTVPSAAVRMAHKKNLELAMQSLERDPIDTRDFASIVGAANPQRIEAARQMTRRFLDRIARLLTSGEGCTEVYHVCVQTYPVSLAAPKGRKHS